MSDIYREPLVEYHRNLRRQNRTMKSTPRIKHYFAWGVKTSRFFDTYEEAYAFAQRMYEGYGRIITVEPVYSL